MCTSHLYALYVVAIGTVINFAHALPPRAQNADFGAYVTYCKNKPVSDNARVEYETYFSQRQNELGQKLSIEDLLITPVQRLPKYQLLVRVSGCG